MRLPCEKTALEPDSNAVLFLYDCVYGAFGNTEFFCRTSYRSPVLDYILTECYRSLGGLCFHQHHSFVDSADNKVYAEYGSAIPKKFDK